MNDYKIAYIVKMFPRLSETFILNEIIELQNLGIQIHIFSSKHHNEKIVHEKVNNIESKITYLPEELCSEKIRIIKAFLTVLKKYPLGTVSILYKEIKKKLFIKESKSLKRYLQACCIIAQLGDIEHIHAHFATVPTRLASLVHKITGISYSITTHAKDIYLDNRLNSKSTLRKFKSARFIVANSNKSKQDIINSIGKKYQNKIFSIYNGIDLEMFNYHMPNKVKHYILSVGRLEDKKGFDLLIKSCKLLIGKGIMIHCNIVGDGPKRTYLENLIDKFNLKKYIKLLGSLSQNDLIKLYKQSMVFVLPCRVLHNGDRDIIPNVLKEAMAIGVPVLTSSIPAMEEIIDNNRNGILVPPEDPYSLANSMEILLNDINLRKKLSIEGRKIIEDKFNIKINIEQLSNLLVNHDTNNLINADRLALKNKIWDRGLSDAI